MTRSAATRLGSVVSRAIAVLVALSAAACCLRRSPDPPRPAACRYWPTDVERETREANAMRTNKLSMFLRLKYRDYLQAVANGQPIAGTVQEDGSCAPPLEQVSVEYHGDTADLERAGLRGLAVFDREVGRLAGGVITLPRLGDLLAVEHVVQVSQAPPAGSQLNYSAAEAGAHALRRELPGATGAGTLVAIIDNGAVDWRHESFRTGQSSRLLAIWDQTLQRTSTETAGPGGVGVVYSRADVEAALRGGPSLRSEDRETTGARAEGHATHTAGIAAGDGSAAGCCHRGGTYVGIAPGADIISVRLVPEADLAFTLGFIRDHPAVAADHRPVVVNISLGINEGAHDGTHRWEEAIDAFVRSGPARIVIVSAGNGANRNQHATATVAPGASVDVQVSIRPNDTARRGVDGWYAVADRFEVQVVSPNGNVSPVARQGDEIAFPDGGTTVTIFHNELNPHGDHRTGILFEAPPGQALLSGTWIVRLTNRGAAAATWHGWCVGEDALSPFFTSHVSRETTLKIPATAREAIVVGAYENRTSWSNCWPSRDIYPASSRGPVRRDAAANPKPDITAPGAGITSANHDACNRSGRCCDCCPDWCCDVYNDSTGTSAAAPHVTGAIALMLQADPTLTRAAIVEHLRLSAKPAPGAADPNVWGGGKLDVAAAVRRVRAALPPPPPPAPGIAPPAPAAGIATDVAAHSDDDIRDLRLPAPAPPRSLAAVLRERLPDAPNRDVVIALVSRHFSEVRRLIHGNRRVATTWHRADGPAALRRLVHPAVPGEAAVRDAAQRDAFARFLGQLERFGSPRLAATIQRHGGDLVAMLATPGASG